jgi:hypothetical protein
LSPGTDFSFVRLTAMKPVNDNFSPARISTCARIAATDDLELIYLHPQLMRNFLTLPERLAGVRADGASRDPASGSAGRYQAGRYQGDQAESGAGQGVSAQPDAVTPRICLFQDWGARRTYTHSG